MKLIIQIPCFNEEQTLPETIRDLPVAIAGIDIIETLVIDDGSTDRTVEVARTLGVSHIISSKDNLGLAQSFSKGLDACLQLGADIIVNTDGDNQYQGADIAELVEPILNNVADIVVGDRQTDSIAHFSPVKKVLQRLGSGLVRLLSGTNIPDAVSGFRAISREAAIKLNIVSDYSYTIEMLIQAGKKEMAVRHVPVRTNPVTRESRLFRSLTGFILHQSSSMIRMYSMYQPLQVFFTIGIALVLLGVAPIMRFLYFYATGAGDGHVQSLILGGVLMIIGFITLMIGLVADLISFNRQLIEKTLEKVRRMELAQNQSMAKPGTPVDES